MDKVNEINKYYVYQHIRLDTNEVFYIGIGTKRFPKKPKKGRKNLDVSIANIYLRAYDKINRNDLWKKIEKKGGRKVEILFESNDYEFVKQKEIELIALYGRITLNNGKLANFTEGGDGKLGRPSPTAIPIFMYNLEGYFIKEFPSAYHAAKELNCFVSFIGEASRSETLRTAKKFIFRKFKEEKIEIPPKNRSYITEEWRKKLSDSKQRFLKNKLN